MARSVEEIFNALVARKESLAALDVYLPQGVEASYRHVLQLMNSNSRVALWLLLFFMVAEAQHTLEVLWDRFSAEVDDRIARHKPGTRLWYRQKALEFQYGDPLVWVDDTYRYAAIDPEKRIVAQASVNDAGTTVRIKVAKVNAQGDLQPLGAAQLAALNAYFVKIRYAGTKTVCVSFDPDTIKVGLLVRYDALLEQEPLAAAVKQAMKGYLKGLPFDGMVALSALVDAVQAVPGVRDVVARQFLATYGNLPDTDCMEAGQYATNAGYAVLDEDFFDDNATWEPVTS